MRKYFILTFLLSFVLSMAQVKFGRVSKEELTKEKSEIDPEAAAEIISKTGVYSVVVNEMENKFELDVHVETRIKIYDKDKAPDELLNITIPARIFGGKNKEKVTGIKAVTYNLQDGKIEETKIKSADIFEEKKHKYLEVNKFAFPNVKNGSVLEFRYNVLTPVFYDLETWFFQTDVPEMYNRFYVSYPDFFIFRPDMHGGINGKITHHKKNTKFRFLEQTDEYVYTHVPALKDEPFVLNHNNLRASVRYELVEYKNPGFGYDNYANTWEQIVKDLYFDSDFGGELKGNNYLEEAVAPFDKMENDIEKMVAIFEHVKTNYSWNQFTSMYPENGVRKTYKDKSGNGADLNFLLISMLQKAGFEANPVVLSTVENGMLNYFPSKRKLNHTITGVIMGEKLFLMDASGKYSKVNMLPTRDLNFKGYMMYPDGRYLEVDLVNRMDSEVKNLLVYTLQDDVVSGKFTQTRTNYFAMRQLEKKDENESKFKDAFLADYDLDVLDFQFQTNPQGDAVRFTVDFEDSKSLENIGNKLFIKPLLFLKTESNAFKFVNEERQFPLEFGTPFTHLSTAKFQIPEGYAVESMPEKIMVQLPQNAGGFNIQFEEKDGHVIVQSITHVSYSVLPPTFYVDVKNMFQKIIEKENQQIILIKK